MEIIMGDFNIIAVGQEFQTSQILSDYVQIVTEPTHISRSLLDHIYIHKHILDSKDDVDFSVTTVHFSDHDAVKFTLHYQEYIVLRVTFSQEKQLQYDYYN